MMKSSWLCNWDSSEKKQKSNRDIEFLQHKFWMGCEKWKERKKEQGHQKVQQKMSIFSSIPSNNKHSRGQILSWTELVMPVVELVCCSCRCEYHTVTHILAYFSLCHLAASFTCRENFFDSRELEWKKTQQLTKLVKAYNNYIYDTFNASLIMSVTLKRKYFDTF